MRASSVIFLCLCNFHIISRRAFSCGRLGGPRVRMSDTIHIPFIPHLSFYISSLCVFCDFCCCFVLPFLVFLRQSFTVALEPVLELALIYQADLRLTESLLLPPSCWYEAMYHYCMAMIIIIVGVKYQFKLQDV